MGSQTWMTILMNHVAHWLSSFDSSTQFVINRLIKLYTVCYQYIIKYLKAGTKRNIMSLLHCLINLINRKL